MNGRNKKQWYALFSNNPTFTDDGNPHDFTKWCERELFGSSKAYLASIDKVGEGGRADDLWGFTRIGGGTSRPFLDSIGKTEKLLRWQRAKQNIEKKMRHLFSLLGQSMCLPVVLLYQYSLENQLALFRMGGVLLDF
ncbi:MAG: hypothetical protein ACJ71D_01735 [Nitrososphaera sp.]